ncbi:hypothetical protein DPX16_22285 [Anabarilius grahami]|uniref:Uncharacterized protein n=1 Tax=Anabarilius grahami TaxID=495550 RepID=A0A3N0Y067_ANAGA|nr:hypothetical protein DPX16_22285 [Anabarilius grahami]
MEINNQSFTVLQVKLEIVDLWMVNVESTYIDGPNRLGLCKTDLANYEPEELKYQGICIPFSLLSGTKDVVTGLRGAEGCSGG